MSTLSAAVCRQDMGGVVDVVSPIEGVAFEEQLLEAIETEADGFSPVGGNDFWHGGVHLRTDKPLVALRDWERVAYRISRMPLVAQVGGARMEYSRGVSCHADPQTGKCREVGFGVVDRWDAPAASRQGRSFDWS